MFVVLAAAPCAFSTSCFSLMANKKIRRLVDDDSILRLHVDLIAVGTLSP